MGRNLVKLATALLFLVILVPGQTATAAWWDNDNTECPCFTASLIDAYFASAFQELPGDPVVIGDMNDISGEIYIGKFQDIWLRANTNYTFGQENSGTCTLIAIGLSEFLSQNQHGAFEQAITQNQHNSCLEEIKGSSAFRLSGEIAGP